MKMVDFFVGYKLWKDSEIARTPTRGRQMSWTVEIDQLKGDSDHWHLEQLR